MAFQTTAVITALDSFLGRCRHGFKIHVMYLYGSMTGFLDTFRATRQKNTKYQALAYNTWIN